MNLLHVFVCLVIVQNVYGLENGQQRALERIYESCGGTKWTRSTNWLTAVDGCTWEGVTCTGDRVQKLILPGNNLVGAVPAEIADLATTLDELNLANNKLTGLPDQFASLTFLRVLRLEGNPINAISFSMRPMVRLTTVDFDKMGLNALPILPTSIEVISADNNMIQTINGLNTNLPVLRVFSCQNNVLTAIDGATATGWPFLQDFDVDHNQLPLIPSFQSQALIRVSAEHNVINTWPQFDATNAALTEILLGHNALPAQIPLFYGVAPQLKILKANNNPLVQTFPPIGTGWRELNALFLSGTAVNTLPADINTAPKLVALEMDAIVPPLNAVPADLAGIATLTSLSLANNSITATFPWASLTALRVLNLDGNGLVAPPAGLPATLQELHLARNAINAAPALGNLVALKVVDLSNNAIAGSATFTFGPAIENVNLANNQLTVLPPAPATCIEYDVSGNPVQEVTPAFFTAGMALKTLRLNDIVLAPTSAALPATVGNAVNLETLEMSNWSPKLLFLPVEIGQLTKLTTLKLRSQNLGGFNANPPVTPAGTALPTQLTQLINLRVLDLSGNRLDAVNDVPALDALGQLTELRMSDNPLKVFPSGVTDAVSLEVIEMRNAQMNGGIPNLEGLTRLRSIDFEGNKLTGSLPVTLLLSASQLTSVNVNNNALSGQVPLQADRLTTGLFGGNHFACGPGATSIGLAAPPACNNPPAILPNGVSPRTACTYGTNRITLNLAAVVPAVNTGESSQAKCKVGEVVVPAVVDGNDASIVYCDVPAYGGANTFPVSFAIYGNDYSSVDASHTVTYALTVCDPFINGGSSGTLRAVTTLMVIFLILLLIVSLAALNLYLKKKKLDADARSYRLLNEQLPAE